MNKKEPFWFTIIKHFRDIKKSAITASLTIQQYSAISIGIETDYLWFSTEFLFSF